MALSKYAVVLAIKVCGSIAMPKVTVHVDSSQQIRDGQVLEAGTSLRRCVSVYV